MVVDTLARFDGPDHQETDDGGEEAQHDNRIDVRREEIVRVALRLGPELVVHIPNDLLELP